MVDDMLLCQKPRVTVAKYREIVKDKKTTEDQKKSVVIEFVRGRFTERYVTPLRAIPVKPKNLRNGFCTMAICCLMIEALESFRRGWKKTPNGELAFCSFFNNSDNLKDFRSHAADFYKHVRCGILHQAETTGGWRITRLTSEPLFDSATKRVNATKFHNEIRKSLDQYCIALEQAAWNSELWKHLRSKLDTICKNCD